MSDLEKYENLPMFENRYEYLTKKYGNMYDINRFDRPRSYFIYDREEGCVTKAKRICEHYVGLKFDNAFSYYCKQVSKFEQRFFFRLFSNFADTNKEYRTFKIDENGVIRLNDTYYRKNYKRKIKTNFHMYSYDAEFTYKNKINGRILSEKEFMSSTYYYYHIDDYEKILIKGKEYFFESEKDPKYKKFLINYKNNKKRDIKRYNLENEKYLDYLLWEDKKKRNLENNSSKENND